MAGISRSAASTFRSKLNKGVTLHIRKQLAQDLDKRGVIKGLGSYYKLEALLDGCISV